MLGTKATAITESAWANRERWQSPKSSPHTLMFLSALPVTRSVESACAGGWVGVGAGGCQVGRQSRGEQMLK